MSEAQAEDRDESTRQDAYPDQGSATTTRAVGLTLLASMATLLFGLLLAARAGNDVAPSTVPIGELLGGLAVWQPAAWLSLGLLLLLVTPLVRLGGMLRDFLRAGQRWAALSASVVILLLVITLVLGLQGRELGAG